jgi:hypothetical protein
MISGIYLITFSASNNRFGEGMIVIDNGAVNGGDATYLYRGRFDNYGDDLKANLEVRHYRGPLNAVLGPLKQFNLALVGKLKDDNFYLAGGIPGLPVGTINITGTKIADLFAE